MNFRKIYRTSTALIEGTLAAIGVLLTAIRDVLIQIRDQRQGTLTDRSGTATTTSAQMMAANAARKYLYVKNTSTGTIWIDFGVAAVVGSPSIDLDPGDVFSQKDAFISTEAVNVRSQTLTRTFTAKEG